MTRKACVAVIAAVLTFTCGAAAQKFPFPHSRTYPFGIKPTNFTQTQMNDDLQAKYAAWRSAQISTDGCQPGEYRVVAGGIYNGGSCSEGMGYGMLMAVYFAGPAFPNSRTEFDGMFRYFKRYLLPEGLMKWRVSADGTTADPWAAPDGDIDVAFALLMADQQWGSSGAINYLQEARTLLGNIMKHAVNKTPVYTISPLQSNPSTDLAPSYNITCYNRKFSAATGDARWDSCTAGPYTSLFKHFYDLNPTTGLIPDWCTRVGYNPCAKSDRKYIYGYDACRVPWRVAQDYLWYGTANGQMAHDLPHRIANWFKSSTGGRPANHFARYNLDGSPAANWASPGNIVAPICVGAMVNPANQEWLNTMYSYLRGVPINGYYESAVHILCMMVITGNFPILFEGTTGVARVPDAGALGRNDITVGASGVVEIFSINGALLHRTRSASPHNAALLTGALPHGSYTLRITGTDGQPRIMRTIRTR